MTAPDWVQDAVFYQIFPDRFANGEPGNDPPNVQPWGAPPTTWGFQGGDLRGIINRFDYLLDLGINALYLNPIFLASSNHRYNTSDYFKIDPKLGSQNDFNDLIDLAHRNGVRVVLDGVFNHSGRGFFAFVDLLENQEHSPYRDWYHVLNYPVRAYGDGDAQDYLAWWGIRSLPKFNTGNPDVRRFLFSVARYWIEQGADGWRLDVPNEINDDSFWSEFRQVVKSANPDAYLMGEIWTVDARWVGSDHFDGLMHYPLRDCLLRLVYAGTLDTAQCASKLEGFLQYYPWENASAMYLLLGSHDTERLMTKVDGDEQKARLAYLLLFAYPGAPAIYYGDEVGMMGGKDPGCRGAFPWDESQWNKEMRNWVKKLVALRKENPVLRRGTFRSVLVDRQQGVISFVRSLDGKHVLVVVNVKSEKGEFHLPLAGLGWANGSRLFNLLGKGEYVVTGDSLWLSLAPWSGAYIASLV